MRNVFKGRWIMGAATQGESVVSHQGFNTLACFFESILTERKRAVCSDAGNKDIFGLNLSGKMLCLPKTVGSTSAGATWLRICQLGLAPGAMLFSQRIDSLAAAGMVLVEVWSGDPICIVDGLGEAFLNTVRTGDHIAVHEDGAVTVS